MQPWHQLMKLLELLRKCLKSNETWSSNINMNFSIFVFLSSYSGACSLIEAFGGGGGSELY